MLGVLGRVAVTQVHGKRDRLHASLHRAIEPLVHLGVLECHRAYVGDLRQQPHRTLPEPALRVARADADHSADHSGKPERHPTAARMSASVSCSARVGKSR